MGVHADIVRALGEIGIERTFAIQELTLPLALAGEDLIGQARTGMGKTFGFGVPLLHRIAGADSGIAPLDGTPRALVIVPTRELCLQVTQDLENASKYLRGGQGPLRVVSIYGGRPYESQIAALRAGVDVVVGTPGRLLDLADQQRLVLGKVAVLVLDEADEMLDLGFLPDIERILGMVPDGRQTMLFSATMPGPIITLARTFLTRPTHIRAEEPHDSAVHDRTAQFVYRAHALDKGELIARVLQAEGRGATMVFTRTKRTAQKVADELADRGFAVGAVHGDLGQIAREKALAKFRKGTIDVLVATDVAARGIDIDDVTHVINYQCPEDEKTYVHRIGRTGRAGRAGVAVTLVDWDELNRWTAIDAALGLGIPDPVETYSRSPHLYADLGIPEGATGQVRKPQPERDPDAIVAERPERTPRKRNRRRTRGGKPLDDHTDTESTPTDAPATDSDSDSDSDSDNGDSSAPLSAPGDADAEERPARRRRRRRHKSADGADTSAEAPAGATDDTSDAHAGEADTNETAPAADSAAADTVEAGSTDTAETGGDRPARRRRRRRKTADSEADGDTGAVDGTAADAPAPTVSEPSGDIGPTSADRTTRRTRSTNRKAKPAGDETISTADRSESTGAGRESTGGSPETDTARSAESRAAVPDVAATARAGESVTAGSGVGAGAAMGYTASA